MKKMNAKAKQKMLAGVALVVVVILVLSGIYVYDKYYKEEEDEVEEEEVFVVDDQISPLENQGVVIEVLRIRHRGLYDRLTNWRADYKTKPTFFFVTNMDGLEFYSNIVGQHGKFEEINFKTWDSMFMERKIVKDCDEEQETSDITLTLFEKVTTRKIIRKTTNDVERDSLTVEYDYRTGRWSGDDNFDDKDGYGHYLGDTFEVWFNIYQMDGDNDFIPYWTEVNVLGTDPRRDDTYKDPDNDGCPTAWEWKWGYDPQVWDDHEKLDPDIDGIQNTEEYMMEKWLANPYHQEVYVEVDSVDGSGKLMDPPAFLYPESAQAMTEKFAEHDISIFFDTGWKNGPYNGGGEVLPFYEKLSQDSGMALEYYNNYFPEERTGVFRYLVLGHKGGYNHPAKNNVYDFTFIAHDPMLPYKPVKIIKNFFTYGQVGTKRGNKIQLAAICMHELGHSVGLSNFEGIDNTTYGNVRFPSKSFKYVDYRSVMNYQCIYEYDVLDYSDGSNGPPYDQNDWEELFIPTFEQNKAYIEEPYYELPNEDHMVLDGEEPGETGYIYDENLTQDVIDMMGDYSPVDPINAKWMALKLVDTDKHPDYKEVKILVKPDNIESNHWAIYGECNLDSDGNMEFYSQQEIIDKIMEEL